MAIYLSKRIIIMSRESRIEYPTEDIPTNIMSDIVEHFKENGLSHEEAFELYRINRIEDQKGKLTDEELQKREEYLAKMEKNEAQ